MSIEHHTRPVVIEGEVLDVADVMPRPLQYPPAVPGCRCGKVTSYGHG